MEEKYLNHSFSPMDYFQETLSEKSHYTLDYENEEGNKTLRYFNWLLMNIQEGMYEKRSSWNYFDCVDAKKYISEHFNEYYGQNALIAISVLNDLIYTFDKYPNETNEWIWNHVANVRERGGYL